MSQHTPSTIILYDKEKESHALEQKVGAKRGKKERSKRILLRLNNETF
jgi:hypothetical protein